MATKKPGFKAGLPKQTGGVLLKLVPHYRFAHFFAALGLVAIALLGGGYGSQRVQRNEVLLWLFLKHDLAVKPGHALVVRGIRGHLGVTGADLFFAGIFRDPKLIEVLLLLFRNQF